MLSFRRCLLIFVIVLCELWSDPVFGVRRIYRKRKLGRTSLDPDYNDADPYGLMRGQELRESSSHSKKPSVPISAIMGNLYSEASQSKGAGRGGSFYPGNRGGPYLKPAVGGYPPFRPVFHGGNSYYPGNRGEAYFKPGVGGQAPYNPGVGGGPSYYNPGGGGQASYNPGNGGGNYYNPGVGEGNSYYNLGGGGQASYNPGAGGSTYYNPGTGGDTSYNPGVGGDTSYNSNGGGDTSYNSNVGGDTSYNPNVGGDASYNSNVGGDTSYNPNVGGDASYNPDATSDGKQNPVNMPFRQEVKSEMNSFDVKWMGSLNGSQDSGKNGSVSHVEVVQEEKNARSLATRGEIKLENGMALARLLNNKLRRDKENECSTVRSWCGESKGSCCSGFRCKQGRCLKNKRRLERRNYGHRNRLSDRLESRVMPFPAVRRSPRGKK